MKHFILLLTAFVVSFMVPKGSNYRTIRFNEESSVEAETDADFKVQVIDLAANGDCTLITYGKTQILIDCGGNGKKSVSNILDVVKASFTDEEDKVLDYVIFSHGDKDHICSFACDKYYSSSESPQVASDSCLTCYLRDNDISIGTFIDFDPNKDESLKSLEDDEDGVKKDLYTKEAKDEKENQTELKTIYREYCNARDYLLDNSNIENYFTSSQCLYQARGAEADAVQPRKENKIGPTNLFTFGDAKKGTIKILNNEYCYKALNKNASVTSLDRNIIATCCLIEFDGYKYLFTGDLPEFDSNQKYKRVGAESLLVENNYDDLKDGVLFYKAAHHGSKTSNSDNLLNVIKPQYISISCDASGQHNFPGDTSLNVMAYYTDKIYITSYHYVKDKDDSGSATPYHGTITFTYKSDNDYDEKLEVTCTGSVGDKDSLMNDSSILWTLADDKKRIIESKKAIYATRTFPIRVMELSSWGTGITPNDCTYIKAGHYDILINDGEDKKLSKRKNENDKFSIEEKIVSLCNDKVLDCLVISSLLPVSYSGLIDKNDGLLTKYINDEHIKKIKNVIVNPIKAKTSEDDKDSNSTTNNDIKTLKSTLISLKKQGRIDKISGMNSSTNMFSNSIGSNDDDVTLSDGNCVRILESDYNSMQSNDRVSKNSLGINVHFSLCGTTFDYLNFGYLDDKQIMVEMEKGVNQFDCMTIPHFGYFNDGSNDYWNNKKKTAGFAALFNGPFGALNTDSKNVYPTSSFLQSGFLGSGTTTTDNFRTNKMIDSSHTNNLDGKSVIDMSAVFSFPKEPKNIENVQYRKFDYSEKYFSNYNLGGENLSKYTNVSLIKYTRVYQNKLRSLFKA